jgi:anti-sigma regulatory factor (Ser/Thr protein kinase)
VTTLGQDASIGVATINRALDARVGSELEELRAEERCRLCARVRSVIVPGLEALADPRARPADLRARAGEQARSLRDKLELEEAVGALASLDAARRRAREHEREWVRGHLHDTALQILEFIAGDGFGTGLSAAKIAHLAGGAARDLRRWIDRVEDAAVAQLLPELERVAEEARSLDHTVRLVVGKLGILPTAEQAAALAGAVREAVTNARKHARASQVIVRVESAGDGRTAVTITDDGIGFDAERAADGSGLGVRHSIVGRMRRVGGHASLQVAPGGGTLVTLLTSRRAGTP